MKITYILSFILIILAIIFIALYFIDIPAPSKLITNDYNLEIK
tara:strand:+ start:891 stop:1019 length:129 start_codon:yes stop_codon:yes gene_type:complete